MKLGRDAWLEARLTLQNLLDKKNPILRDNQNLRQRAFVKQTDAELHLPVQIGINI